MATVRTRFAPSPTGFLHLGSARTALFAWAFARRHGGQFILRIEDTDVERSTKEAIKAILDAMAWLDLDYDEGPYYQMQRLDRYKIVLDDMLERGLAYRCYTTPQELEALRAEQMARGEKPRYDGRWRPENLQPGQTPPAGIAPVYRFKNPTQGSVAWDDQVKGHIEISNAELDDLVIVRGDGIPTYNFGVIVDDLDMGITHVIRGDDHVNNTPRQINVIRALGAEPPVYGHLPTVLGADGTKLSKRHGAVSVMQYAEDGFLPDAMINALARLGWSHGDDEVFSRAQLVEWFDIGHVHAAPARFDGDKLRWVNHEHIKRLPDAALGERLRPFLEKAKLDVSNGPPPASVAALLRDRAPTLVRMAQEAEYFYGVTPGMREVQEKFAAKVDDAVRSALGDLCTTFQRIDWTREAIGSAIKATAAKHGLKPPQVMMAVRTLVTGTPQTPAIDAVLVLIGRDRTVERLGRGLAT
ncbi:MAG: glutamate--tRNA ligase [Betaproteobacteria bacterium]|nr:MAG: glutamate--tRNA ligase [Betaproteobacteria bacterium]TMH47691.1 MAG: glutamate--tRNA ligase [Betaproteobacteria bacterium]